VFYIPAASRHAPSAWSEWTHDSLAIRTAGADGSGTLRGVKLLYAPFSIAAGVVGARIGKRAFSSVWSLFSEDPKPKPTEGDQGLVRVAASAALEGAMLSAVAAVINQLTARAFHAMFGAWPGQKPKPEPAAE